MKRFVFIAVLGWTAGTALALEWNSVPMATGTNVANLRGWLVADPAGDSLYYSPWNGTNYTVYGIGGAAARDYGVTTGGDWSSIAAPASFTSATSDDDGTAFNVLNGRLYAVTKVNGGARQLVRLDLATQTWQPGVRPASGANSNYAGVVYDSAGTTKFLARWSGSRNFDYGTVTDEATFAYTEAAKGNATGFWGQDATFGNGYMYVYEQGLVTGSQAAGWTYGPNQLRRANLSSAAPQDELATPWVDAQGPLNNHHNRRTNASIEFIPGGINGAGDDELWVLPAAFTDPDHPTAAPADQAFYVNVSNIYRYRASNGTFIGTEPLPFAMTDMGQGYDMAYMNGWLYVMQGRSTNVLWSTQLPEPASLGLLMLGSALALRRRR